MAERTDVATRMRVSNGEAERSADEIRQDIAAKRDSISETVDKLGDRLHQTLDWREYVADYPLVALGVAAGLGFMLSGMFKRRPSPRERMMDAMAETLEDITDQLRSTVNKAVNKQSGGIGKTAKAALTATLTKAALDYAKSRAGGLLGGDDRGDRAPRYQPTDAMSYSARDINTQSDVGLSRPSTIGS